MNDLIRAKLKEIVNLQYIIKKENQNISQSVEKLIILANIHYLLFSIDIHEGYLSLEDAHNKQSNLATELKNFEKDIKAIEKKSKVKPQHVKQHWNQHLN